MTNHELNVQAAEAVGWTWAQPNCKAMLKIRQPFSDIESLTVGHPGSEWSPATSIEYAMGLLDTLQCDWIMMAGSIAVLDEGDFLPLPYKSNLVEYRGSAGRARAITEAFIATIETGASRLSRQKSRGAKYDVISRAGYPSRRSSRH